MKKYSFNEIYNHLIMRYDYVVPQKYRRLAKCSDTDIQIGDNTCIDRYVAPINMGELNKENILWDKSIEERLEVLDCKKYDKHNLVCVIRGERLSVEQAREILLSTSHYNYMTQYKEYFDNHVYIGPLKAFELFAKATDASPEEIEFNTYAGHEYGWLHEDGKVRKTFTIQVSTPSIVDMLSDAWNLAVAFPYLDICFYLLDRGSGKSHNYMDTYDDNKIVYGFVRDIIEDEKWFDAYSIITFHVHDGCVDVVPINEAYQLLKESL